MESLTLNWLFCILAGLILCSGFFSGSETGMMALNRYKLQHQAKQGHRLARIVMRLLERPDRVLGVILIGNTFANIFASAVATIIAIRLWGDMGVAIATIVLTLLILIFAEITPKTLAAKYPQTIAFVAVYPLYLLLLILYPLVWIANFLASNVLRLFRIPVDNWKAEALNKEELRTIVDEQVRNLPRDHQIMLLHLLDLETITVDEIMVPANDIVGIDLEEDITEITEQLCTSQHTRLPIYRNDIDLVEGILHIRHLVNLMADEEPLTKDALLCIAAPVYFVPEGTSLATQLIQFQKHQRRTAIVVDEYGDVLGLVTIEDILEEIVGKFTTDFSEIGDLITEETEHCFLVDGSITIRELNQELQIAFPTDGPRTLSGLLIEQMESIPTANTSLLVGNQPVEIVQVKENRVKTARIDLQEKKRG